jgi:hypothetical protein
MVLLVHKESKSTNEFIRFSNELGEFLANSITYEQLRNFEYFNDLI